MGSMGSLNRVLGIAKALTLAAETKMGSMGSLNRVLGIAKALTLAREGTKVLRHGIRITRNLIPSSANSVLFNMVACGRDEVYKGAK